MSEKLSTKQHLLTVLLEDYFHVGAFNHLIQRGQWYRFETRFEQNTLKALDLLDRHGIKATFFVLGWIADKQPEIVREVARRGHEIANRGYYHRSIQQMTPEEFREDLSRSREALERASGMSVIGYRAARKLSAPQDLWALDVLAEEGYAYDSSFVPNRKILRTAPQQRFAHQHHHNEKSLWEFPVSTVSLLGWHMPVAGGNYFRQFPHAIVRRVVQHWHATYDAPFVMYMHVWELDPEQPRISGASPLMKIRHYRNLHKMAGIIEDYLKRYSFVGIGDYLNLDFRHENALSSSEAAQVEKSRLPLLVSDDASKATAASSVSSTKKRKPVSVVVPCFNEELILPYLSNTLKSVEQMLESDYDLQFIFVDDSSTDRTWDALHELFSARANSAFVRHTENKGVAAAILSGISSAESEVVCSIDCDCTYDPHELSRMIPQLSEGVDMVTASPYHPEGQVRNVPGWRLSLSRGASFLYRQVLNQKLYTYTSCFRVYRRSALMKIRLNENGFLGVTEMLGRLDLQGSKVVEHPATLEVRLFGRSKMKVLRTIRGHLKLLARLSMMKMRRRAHDERERTAEMNLLKDAKALASHVQTPPATPQK
ncbi:MAG TPA: XrtA system polysaccharide deacetylase [Pyrinomonadaceae bacterium]|jgi:polysaccharide deacetylase family protein (PEP-CTERM system associated)